MSEDPHSFAGERIHIRNRQDNFDDQWLVFISPSGNRPQIAAKGRTLTHALLLLAVEVMEFERRSKP